MNLILTQFFLILTAALILWGCDSTSPGGLAKVQIRMPNLINTVSLKKNLHSNAKLNFRNFSNQSNVFNASRNPSLVSEINCYAVIVSGPESFYRRTSCEVQNNQGQSVSELKLGLFAGLTASNQVLNLNIIPGANRKFTLVGLKADPISTCRNLQDPNLQLKFISEGFILGESDFINLSPGETTNVIIRIPQSNQSIATNSKKIGQCAGPDSPVDFNRVLPTQALIEKNFFPFQSFAESSCQSFDIEFANAKFQKGLSQFDTTLSITRAINNQQTFNSFNIFENLNCTGPSSSSTSIVIDRETLSKRIYFQTDLATSVNQYQFKLEDLNSNYPISISIPFSNLASDQVTLDSLGPKRILPDQCYNLLGFFRNINTSLTSGTELRVSLPTFESRIYSNKNCGDPDFNSIELVSPALFSVIPNSSFDFSLVLTQDPFAKTFFTFSNPIVSGITYSQQMTYPIEVLGGTQEPTQLAIDLPKFLPGTNGLCLGPFQALVENEQGAALNVVNSTISIATSGTVPTSQFQFRGSSDCSVSLSSSIFGKDYRKIFYILVGPSVVLNSPYILNFRGEIEKPETSLLDDPESVTLNATSEIRFQ